MFAAKIGKPSTRASAAPPATSSLGSMVISLPIWYNCSPHESPRVSGKRDSAALRPSYSARRGGRSPRRRAAGGEATGRTGGGLGADPRRRAGEGGRGEAGQGRR